MTSSDDTAITLYVEAAEEYIRNFLNSRIPGEDQDTPNIPKDVKAAALLIIGGMYEYRSDKLDSSFKDNPAVMNLLHPYRQEIGI